MSSAVKKVSTGVAVSASSVSEMFSMTISGRSRRMRSGVKGPGSSKGWMKILEAHAVGRVGHKNDLAAFLLHDRKRKVTWVFE